MFYDNFLALCEKKGISPSRAVTDMGMNRSIATFWKNGTVPKMDTLTRIADYFEVSVGFLVDGADTEKKAPALTEKDRRDVAKDVYKIMESLESTGELMFDGVPMSEESKAAMAAAMRIGLEEARRRNKALYTPKKFRKE